MKRTFKEHWEQIIKWYDFEKVKKTMDALNWTWFDSDQPPSIGRIVESARDICKSAYDRNSTASTKGFSATYNKEEDILFLEFIVEEWNTEYED
jgi:hypothetical protein